MPAIYFDFAEIFMFSSVNHNQFKIFIANVVRVQNSPQLFISHAILKRMAQFAKSPATVYLLGNEASSCQSLSFYWQSHQTSEKNIHNIELINKTIKTNV